MTKRIALLHNHYDEEKLESIKDEMKNLGAPRIKAVWMEVWGVWAALEGCHRIRAAKDLGLVPEIQEVEYSEDVTLEEIGCECDNPGLTVADVADMAFESEVVEFD
jgi:hypothetical protein